MRITGWLSLALSLLGLAGLAACSSVPANLPAASGVLQNAAQAMGSVSSTAFSLQLSGDLSSQFVSTVSGSISADGQADGSVTIGGQAYPFRLIAGTFYLQNPNRSWVTSPPPFDPTQLLDPTNGLASLLTGATGARTVNQVGVGGETADEITARVPAALINQLTNLADGQPSLAATLWIGATDYRLLQFQVTFRGPNAQGDTFAKATLKDFNVPLHVVAPKT